jgi:hypothetical protein
MMARGDEITCVGLLFDSILNDDASRMMEKIEQTHIPVDFLLDQIPSSVPGLLRHIPSLIQMASFLGAVTCVQTLFAAGADLQQCDGLGHPVADFACCGRLDICMLLRINGVTFTTQSAVLSAQFNRVDMMRWLFEIGVIVAGPSPILRWTGSCGSIKLVRRLVGVGVTDDGYAVEEAAKRGHGAVVQFLMDAGALPAREALVASVRSGYVGCVTPIARYIPTDLAILRLCVEAGHCPVLPTLLIGDQGDFGDCLQLAGDRADFVWMLGRAGATSADHADPPAFDVFLRRAGGTNSLGLANEGFVRCEHADRAALEMLTVSALKSTIAVGGFDGCVNLRLVDLRSVVVITERAFTGCTSLEYVLLSDSLTEIGRCAFEGCAALRTFTMPSGLCGVGPGAFRSCPCLALVAFQPMSNLREFALDVFETLPRVEFCSMQTSRIAGGAGTTSRFFKSASSERLLPGATIRG